MKTPPLLLGAALFFWGWETGLPWLGAALGLGLEASRLARRDWDPGLKQFSRISDACAVGLAGLTVYFYATQPAVAAFAGLLKFSVLPLYPVLLAQAFSARGAVDAGALFYSLRRGAAGRAPGPFLDLSRGFFLVCLLAAGAANARGPVFYAGIVTLLAWLLWPVRPVYARGYVWLPLLALAGLLGYAGQHGLHNLQVFLEGRAVDLVFAVRDPGDPYRTTTAIGQVGRIKQHGNIVLRLKKNGPGRAPALLRDASFDTYRAGEWQAKDAPFLPAEAAPDAGWAVAAGSGTASFSAYSNFKRGRGLLALPAGARLITGLPAEEVERNRLGTLRVYGAPSRASYEVNWQEAPAAGRDAPPGAADLALPPGEAAAARRLAAQLGLARLPPERALAALHDYFSREFTYTLYQAEPAEKSGSPVERFLTKTRAGHCEYFGTATALVLRAAGIPARYATGYSVQEYSRLQKSYLIRQRHAHAWALAYVGGTWTDADNTPASWLDAESARAGAAEPLLDAWSWLVYNIFTFRPELPAGTSGPPVALLGACAAAALWLAARRLLRRRSAAGAAAAPDRPGLDSEFYAVEGELAAAGLGRRQGESLRAWALRLGAPGSGLEGAAELQALAALHGRLRFDPEGLPPAERERLRAGARAWLRSRKAGR